MPAASAQDRLRRFALPVDWMPTDDAQALAEPVSAFVLALVVVVRVELREGS